MINLGIEIGDVYALSGAATFAFSSAIIRKMEPYGNALQLNFIRAAIGAVIFVFHFLLISQLSNLLAIPTLIILYLVLSVLTNVVIGDTSYFASQNLLGIKIATPLANTFPFVTILIAVIWLDEIATPRFLLGGLVLISGIIFLSLDRIEGSPSIGESTRRMKIIGFSLVLLAVICYALGVVFTTVATVDLDPVVANAVRLPAATILLGGYMTLKNFTSSNDPKETGTPVSFFRKVNAYPRNVKLLLLVAGVFGTYLSSLFLVLAVQNIGAGRSSILFSTGPFFSLPIAILWLKEKASAYTIIGTLLTVFGLWVVLT